MARRVVIESQEQLYAWMLAAGDPSLVWIVCDTRLAADLRKKHFPDSSGKFHFFTTSELWLRLATLVYRAQHETVHWLDRNEQQLVIAHFLEKFPERFPILTKDYQTRPNRVLSEVLYFVETMRLTITQPQWIHSTLDEIGNPHESRARFEEILILESDLGNFARETGFFEVTSALTYLLETVSASREAQRVITGRLPGTIIFDQPFDLSPLECAVIEGLMPLIPIHFALPEEVFESSERKPELQTGSDHFQLALSSFVVKSERDLASLAIVRPADSSRKVLSQIALLGRTASSNQENFNFANLELRSFATRQDEIEAVAECIEQAREQRQLAGDYSAFHIVVPELDMYYDEICRVFQRRNIPVDIPRGGALRINPAGTLLLLWLAWLKEPRLSSYFALLSHPLFNLAPAGEQEKSPLALGDFVQICRRLGQDEIIRDTDSWFESFRHRYECFQRASHAVADFRAIRPQLATLKQFIELRTQICNAEPSNDETFKQIQSAYFRFRRPARLLKIAERRGILDVVRGYRHIRALVSGLRKETRYAHAISLLPRSPGQMFESLERAVHERFVTTTKRVNGVLVTEFLDIRGLRDKTSFVLGMTSEVFSELPKRYRHRGEVDEFSVLLERRRYGRGKLFQRLALFSHLLHASQKISLSFPREVCGEEVAPAEVFANLAHFGFPYLAQERTSLRIELGDEKLHKRRKHHFQERWRHTHTAYDGRIGTYDQSPERVSVTQLQTLADCRHRFFFSKILGLKPFEEFLSLLNREVGMMVHATLERFIPLWKKNCEVWDDTEIFSSLRSIATRILERSSIVWDSHPAARMARHRILEGLDQGSSRWGMLRAACEYQRQFIQTWPCAVEQHFGSQERGLPGLSFSINDKEILVTGIIDRIDSKLRDDGRTEVYVWDYKSGRPPSRSEIRDLRVLQLPLYLKAALALSEQFVPAGGGYIALSRSELQGEDLNEEIRNSIIVDGFAVGKSEDPRETQIAEIIAKAEAVTAALLEKVQHGDFSQQLDTEGCPHCEFRRICARDEARIDFKDQSVGVSTSSAPKGPREIVNSSLPRNESAAVKVLSSEQAAAVYANGPVVLVAGAGSGKTTVLESRVLRLLAEGVRLDSIVAITFTEKAAEEIRSRVRSSIEAALERGVLFGQELNQQQRIELQLARDELPLANFGTIHGFCAGILEMDLDLSGALDDEEIMHPAEREDFIGGVIREVFQDPYILPEKDDVASFAHHLESIMGRESHFRDVESSLNTLLLLPEHKLQIFINRFTESNFSSEHDLELLEQIVSRQEIRSWRKISGSVQNWLGSAQDWLSEVKGSGFLTEDQEESFSQLFSATQQVLTCEQQADSRAFHVAVRHLLTILAERKASAKRVSKKNPRNYWKELADVVRDSRLVDCEFSEPLERQARDQAQHLLLCCSIVLREIKRRKRALRKIDFDDIIFRVHRMVCGEFENELGVRQQWLRQRLARRFQHVMVDEFQDTDVYQWDIVRSLVTDWSNVEKSFPAGKTLLIIGDRQQAIYGFRGGDVRVFEQAADFVRSCGGQELSLVENYRSQPGIINFVNHVFSDLFSSFPQTQELDSVVRTFQPMEAKRNLVVDSSQGESVSVMLYDASSTTRREGGEHESDMTIEARAVAAHIRKLLDRDSFVSDKGPQASVAAGPSIACITRTVRQLVVVSEELQAQGVPFQIFHSNGFFELDEIIQFENLFRAFSTPFDEIACVGVLRSVLFGLSDRDLLEVKCELNGEWARLLEPSQVEGSSALIQEIAETFSRWKHYFSIYSFSAALHAILEDTQLAASYTESGLFEATLNVGRFLERIDQAARNGEFHPSFEGAAIWMVQQARESRQALSVNSKSDPVVLMTIHGSKGLEFPTVILPFLGRRHVPQDGLVVGEVFDGEDFHWVLGMKVSNPQSGFARKDSAYRRLLLNQDRVRRAEEEARLFYVACTRARDRLVMVFPRDTLGAQVEKRRTQEQSLFGPGSDPLQWIAKRCAELAPDRLRLDIHGRALELNFVD